MLAHFLSGLNRREVSRMAYRRTDNVIRRLAARHDAIIAAAGALAGEAGINAVQIGPVAERAGIAAGTLSRYFSSQTHVIAALWASVSVHAVGAMAPAGAGARGRVDRRIGWAACGVHRRRCREDARRGADADAVRVARGRRGRRARARARGADQDAGAREGKFMNDAEAVNTRIEQLETR